MRRAWIRVAVVLVLLVLWELGVQAGGQVERFPRPLGVWDALWRTVAHGTLQTAVRQSLTRVLLAFALAFVAGVGLGIALRSFATLDRALTPIIEALRSIAPIAWVPMAMLWLGITGKAAIFIVAYAAIFPIIVNTYQAVRVIDRRLIQAARTLGADTSLVLRDVIFKSALPTILVGARIAMGFAWASIIAAELAMGIKLDQGARLEVGLGQLMVRTLFIERDIDALVLYMVTIGIIGLLIDQVMRRVRALATPWVAA
jgi:ABC-type nitrate/sulfonate/bicarbonate transport system permease component